MKEKIKKIKLRDVNLTLFGLYTLFTMYSINYTKRWAFILLSFVVYSITMFYLEVVEIVRNYKINTSINIQKYWDSKEVKND